MSYSNFARLKVQLGKVTSVFAGNDCPLPLWLGDNNCKSIAELNCSGKLHFRLWQSHVQRSIEAELHSNPVMLNLETSDRGFQTLPRITIESFFPLGLFRCWTHIRFDNKVLVYPNPIATELTLHNQQSGDEEALSMESIIGNNDFDTLKNYEPGEPLNRVAWKLVAKGGEMMTKQFSDSFNSTIWLDIKHFQSEDLETALSKMTWLVIQLTQRQVSFGLKLEENELAPETGNQHMERCLQLLATFKIREPGSEESL